MSLSLRRLAAGTVSLLAVLAGTAAVAAPAQAAGEDGTGNPETWTVHAHALCL